MSNRLAFHYGQNVNVQIGPVSCNDGRVRGTFLKITTPELFGTVEGLDGHVARYAKNNRMYMGELTLLQTSSVHAELQAILITDFEADGGAGVVPFLVEDPNGTALIASEFCWVYKAPDLEFGEEVKEASPWLFTFVADPKQAFTNGA